MAQPPLPQSPEFFIPYYYPIDPLTRALAKTPVFNDRNNPTVKNYIPLLVSPRKRGPSMKNKRKAEQEDGGDGDAGLGVAEYVGWTWLLIFLRC